VSLVFGLSLRVLMHLCSEGSCRKDSAREPRVGAELNLERTACVDTCLRYTNQAQQAKALEVARSPNLEPAHAAEDHPVTLVDHPYEDDPIGHSAICE